MSEDHTPINEKWNGRQVYVGPRGGKYILDPAGERRYLREFESVRRGTAKDQRRKKAKRKFNPRRHGVIYRTLKSQQQL